MKYFHSLLILITAIVLILCCPLTATAKTTNLYTSIPEQVVFTVKMSGNGAVTVNGQAFTKSGSMQVDRLEDVTVSISANAENSLKSIHLNKSDIAEQVTNGTLIIENIQFDTTLEVLFAADAPWIPEDNPATGDDMPACLYLLCAVSSWIIIILLLRSNSKKEYET